MIFWGIILAIHLLAVTVWVGGLFHAEFVLRPSVRELDNPSRLRVHLASLERFLAMVWIAMPATLVSGYLMLFGFYGGLNDINWTIQVMHPLGLAMAAVFMRIYFTHWRRLGADPVLFELDPIRRLSMLGLGLGVLTIVIACLKHFS